MPSQRQKRVSGLIQFEISDIIRTRMRDPRLGFVTVTEVAVSADLRNARVYVSILGNKAEKDKSMDILHGAAAFIQTELSSRVQLRYIPVLKFYLDTSLEYMDKINHIFTELHENENSNTNLE